MVADDGPADVPASLSAAGKLARKLREHVLEMEDGEFIGSQDELLNRYGVNVPTLRQAMVALMNEQLVTSRRGVGGGFFVRRPDAAVVTHIVALYLRSRAVALSEQIATLLPVRGEIARRAACSHDLKAREELVAFLEREKHLSLDMNFAAFNAAEREFNRLLARLSGSTTLTLFLEILLDLSQMIYESDVFDGRADRRVTYRITRNLVASSVLAHDPVAAARYARKCSKLTSCWLSESRPDLLPKNFDIETPDDMFTGTATPGDETEGDDVTAKETDMADEGASAVSALRRLDEQQRDLDVRRTSLEQAAATELGGAVISGGGLAINPAELETLIRRVVLLGIDEAMTRLQDGSPA